MRTNSLKNKAPVLAGTVGMKPLSERDENQELLRNCSLTLVSVGMKPLSERDENNWVSKLGLVKSNMSRNEATL